MRWIVAVLLLGARTVYADCIFHNGYYSPEIEGVVPIPVEI
jgi:hypothetical protein